MTLPTVKNNMTQLLDSILSLWFFQQGHEVGPKVSFECNAQFSGKQIVNDPKTFYSTYTERRTASETAIEFALLSF